MDTEEELLSFMTWNARGLKSKQTEVEGKIQGFDVAFIQETHIGKKDTGVLEDFKEWKSVFTNYKPGSRGVAVLIKKEILEEARFRSWMDDKGSFVVVRCTLRGQLYTLVSVYIPQGDSRPLEELREILERFSRGILLIGGDFNIALNPYLDKSSTEKNPKHCKLKPAMEKLISSFHLVDVWRRLNPISRQYTFTNVSRLDYLFVPEESMQYVKTCEISKKKPTDHKPVTFKIRCNTINTPNDLYLIKKTDQRNVSEYVSEVLQQWLVGKQNVWGDDFILTCSQDAFEKFQDMNVEKTIQSLAVNRNKGKRPDGVSLLFYKRYSYDLIPHLCVLYHNFFKKPNKVLESFSKSDQISGTLQYIFNVDYMILATIMARWLNEYLLSHSKDIRDQKGTVLFAWKEGSEEISWLFLKKCLKEATVQKPPLSPKFNIGVLNKLLKNSSCGTEKLLCRGCPLTPELKRLCLTHLAKRFLESKQLTSEVYISRENVIVQHVEGDLPLVVSVEGDFRFEKSVDGDSPEEYVDSDFPFAEFVVGDINSDVFFAYCKI